MKFGTLQNVLGDPLPQVFQVAADLGFDGVELDWNDAAEVDEGGVLGPGGRQALRDTAGAAGVEICSVAAHFLNQGGLADPDPEKQRAAREVIREALRLCTDLGARVLLVPFFGPGVIDGPGGLERLRANLLEIAPEVELAQVYIGLEHTLPADEIVPLIETLGSPWIGNYFDMGNALYRGYDPVGEVETLGRHIVQVHAKEFDGGDGPAASRDAPRADAINTKPLGEGQVPLREVLAALRSTGFDGYVVLETGAFGDRHESARSALEALKAAR